MERGAGGGHHHHATAAAAAGHSYMTTSSSAEEHMTSSFDNPATKKKPPKLKAINRSISMAIDNYDGSTLLGLNMGGGGGGGGSSPTQLMYDDDALIVEQPLIHRAASPLAAVRSLPPQSLTLAPPSGTHHAHYSHTQLHGSGSAGGSGAVSPALSTRQQQHLHTFQNLAVQARHHSQHRELSSSTSSPTSHHSPLSGYAYQQQQQQHQPDIYLVSSSSLGDDMGAMVGAGGSTSPIQFIDDYMLPPSTHRNTASATHPLKKGIFRRSDTIDVHPASTFQMKKTHSFHTQQDPVSMDHLLLMAGGSNASSRRTSSVRGNFLMPGGHQSGKDLSRSPSPSRRGCRSHRSFNDPTRRPSNKPDSIVDSQIRHPSLNDDLMEAMDGRGVLVSQAALSLENELFVESRSRSSSHTQMDDVGISETATVAGQRNAAVAAVAAALLRKSSGSFDENLGTSGGAAGGIVSATHPPASSSSLKKRSDHPHSRQHSSHSLELDGRPSTSAAAAAAASSHQHAPHSMHMHSAAAAATAAYHFKRAAQHGRSLYLSPNNFDELQVHRPGVLAAAAAFQGSNASVKQAKALHSASMRLRTYREALSATKKSKSFIGEGAFPRVISGVAVGNEFELTSPHRRNSRPLTTASNIVGNDDIKRSPRPLTVTTSVAGSASVALTDEKRPSFERNPSLTYELSDTAFEQVLRPFHHKVAGRKASMTAGGSSHKALKKKSLSDETGDDDEADRKRKRIVCIVMTVFLCLVCASVLVVIFTLTHSSSSTQHHHHHHQTSKKIYTFTRETPVHYNVRQENERLMKETMDRARFGKNYTEASSALISTPSMQFASLIAADSSSSVGGGSAAPSSFSSMSVFIPVSLSPSASATASASASSLVAAAATYTTSASLSLTSKSTLASVLKSGTHQQKQKPQQQHELQIP